MRVIHGVLAVALALLLGFGAQAADKAGKKGKKATHAAGVVDSVQADADGKGSLTIKTVASKKDSAAQPVEKKFTITKDTKIEKVAGKKGQTEISAAKLSDVAKGDRVAIVADNPNHPSLATSIQVHAAKKKKKA